jgi:hypothetical protein
MKKISQRIDVIKYNNLTTSEINNFIRFYMNFLKNV